jgi:hypothetical protein
MYFIDGHSHQEKHGRQHLNTVIATSLLVPVSPSSPSSPLVR